MSSNLTIGGVLVTAEELFNRVRSMGNWSEILYGST